LSVLLFSLTCICSTVLLSNSVSQFWRYRSKVRAFRSNEHAFLTLFARGAYPGHPTC
jgi:hypothetical protein